MTNVAWLVIPLVASAAIVWLVRGLARRRQILDNPNDRSSHSVPRPRLGGVGIVVPLVAFGGAMVARGVAPSGTLVILAATAAISVVGLVDDLSPLAARWRFGAQVFVATATVVALRANLVRGAGGIGTWAPAWILGPLAVVWIVWLTNLFNFMDGIDGLAGGQALIASLGLALAASATGATGAWGLLLVLGASSLGFLLFNFPPASIFMGDVGSTAIGFFFGCLPLLPGEHSVPVEAVAIALSLFVLDATTTLLRRIARGERWFEAHRTHLYQRPVVMGVPHRTVTLVAYAGMAVAAACAAAWPSITGLGRVGLVTLPVLLFLLGHAAVRRVEPENS
jgi:UDP-N-acetylmuramyl pentapeptide phosphotransferase/UDP-N-acetylglucosamine-1-phosphate transferase